MEKLDLNKSGFHSQFGIAFISRQISNISLKVRKKMYSLFEKNFLDSQNVLDVGVTSENTAPEANFFEELYPYKERITAVGVEDAQHLEEKYKGLKFIKIRPGQKLPFTDRYFDVSFSNAVIEHITDENQRQEFVNELLRVSNAVFLTTPNKYFPIELHTGMPLIHFCLPRLFNFLLNKMIISKFYNTDNLRLLNRSELKRLAERTNVPFEILPVYLFGFVSNWVLILKQKA